MASLDGDSSHSPRLYALYYVIRSTAKTRRTINCFYMAVAVAQVTLFAVSEQPVVELVHVVSKAGTLRTGHVGHPALLTLIASPAPGR